MKFNSKSVLLNDGVNVKLAITIPEVFNQFAISDQIWVNTVKSFNEVLNARQSVTETVNGSSIDILELQPIGPLVMTAVVKKEDAEKFGKTWFSIKGQIVFCEKSMELVDKIIISDIIYKSEDGTTHFVLSKT